MIVALKRFGFQSRVSCSSFGFSVFSFLASYSSRPRLPESLFSSLVSKKRIQSGFFWSVSSLSTAQPERGWQSTAKRAKRAELIERRETVDGRHSGGYSACAT